MTHDELDEERRLLARCTIDGRSVWWCIHTLTTVRGRASARLPCRCHLEQAGEDVLAKLGEGCHDHVAAMDETGWCEAEERMQEVTVDVCTKVCMDESVSHVQSPNAGRVKEGSLPPLSEPGGHPARTRRREIRRQRRGEVTRVCATHATAHRAEERA